MVLLAALAWSFVCNDVPVAAPRAALPALATPTPFVHRIDHQFRGPGDVQFGVFDSRFNDPELLKYYHYTAQAGRYAETALTFDALRPNDPFFPTGSPVNASPPASPKPEFTPAATGVQRVSE